MLPLEDTRPGTWMASRFSPVPDVKPVTFIAPYGLMNDLSDDSILKPGPVLAGHGQRVMCPREESNFRTRFRKPVPMGPILPVVGEVGERAGSKGERDRILEPNAIAGAAWLQRFGGVGRAGDRGQGGLRSQVTARSRSVVSRAWPWRTTATPPTVT